MPCLGEPIQFDRALKAGDELDAKFSWGEATKRFSLSAVGILSPTALSKNPKLSLPIDKEEFIEQLFVQRHDNDLMLAFQTSDGDSGRGFICRIKWPQNTIQWCQTIPGFNIDATASMGSIYIGAIGFLGRLDPKDGKYLWSHDGLYEKDPAFNILCLAKEDATTVLFNATSGIRGADVKQISLDRNTGKIIRISVVELVGVCHPPVSG